MSISKERKALVGLLSLGLLALGADRLTSGPTKARAQPPGAEPAAPVAASPSRASGPLDGHGALQPAVSPLLHRMRALPEVQDPDRAAAFDAFKPPLSWLPPVVEAEPEPPAKDDRVERFREAHKLSAVITGPGECAVIGGRMVRVGQELDGFVLVAIGDRSAVFLAEGVEIVLALPEPGPSRSGNGHR